jgi:predicted XRE-type DNA-binding protein
MTKKNSGRIGGSFDAYLADEGLLDACEAQAIKEVLALQVSQALRAEGISKAEMARRMHTSRPALDRLLDPRNTSVTLHTLQRAAAVLGKRVRLDLVDAPPAR